jgi:hypothetical protein
VGSCPMVNIYCPACHISSPRELRELAHPRPFCTACGRPLNSRAVEVAMSRHTAPQQAGNQNYDGAPILAESAVVVKASSER